MRLNSVLGQNPLDSTDPRRNDIYKVSIDFLLQGLVFLINSEKSVLQPRHQIDLYIEKTQKLRYGENQLLLATISTHKFVYTQTISK